MMVVACVAGGCAMAESPEEPVVIEPVVVAVPVEEPEPVVVDESAPAAVSTVEAVVAPAEPHPLELAWAEKRGAFLAEAATPQETLAVRSRMVFSLPIYDAMNSKEAADREAALAVLGEMMDVFRRDAIRHRDAEYEGFGFITVRSLASLTKEEAKQSEMLEKLFALNRTIGGRGTAEMESLIDLPVKIRVAELFKPLPRDEAFAEMLETLKAESMPSVEKHLARFTDVEGTLTLLEKALLAADGIPITSDQYKQYSWALARWPERPNVFEQVAWFQKARGPHHNPFEVDRNAFWHDLLDAKLEHEGLAPAVDLNLAFLDESNLVVTAAMLRFDSRFIYREAIDLQPSEFEAVAFAFDPPLSRRNGSHIELVRRLGHLPWVDRGLSRYFGVQFESADAFRAAAEAADVELGGVEVDLVDGDRTLVALDRPPVLTTLNPWETAALSAGASPLSDATRMRQDRYVAERDRLTEIREALDARAGDIALRRSKLNEDIDANNALPEGRRFGAGMLKSRQEALQRDIDRFNRRKDEFNRELAALRDEMSDFGEQANKDRWAGRRAADAEVDEVLRRWYEDRLSRHADELRKAGVHEESIERELEIARWLVLPPSDDMRSPASTSRVADDYFDARREAELRDLWMGDDRRAILRKIRRFGTSQRAESELAEYVERFGKWALERDLRAIRVKPGSEWSTFALRVAKREAE